MFMSLGRDPGVSRQRHVQLASRVCPSISGSGRSAKFLNAGACRTRPPLAARRSERRAAIGLRTVWWRGSETRALATLASNMRFEGWKRETRSRPRREPVARDGSDRGPLRACGRQQPGRVLIGERWLTAGTDA